MVGAAMKCGVVPRPWQQWILLVGLLGVGGGCTMCPDPFDYSGPVPNGTPPQNDFRARSGGIFPLGSAPRPWPSVVKDAAEPNSSMTASAQADLPEESAEDALPSSWDLEQTGARLADPELAAMPPAADMPLQPELEPVPLREWTPAATQPEVESTVAPAQPPASTTETPGWRPRG